MPLTVLFLLVLALRLANRLVVLPQQQFPDVLAQVPPVTVLSLLLIAAPAAGIIEEAATLVWTTGADASFVNGTVALAIVSAAAAFGYVRLARATRPA